ncbi:MAG TPA: hypothetical protein VGD98_24355 [Ktedonobacteraceae bacterium]
MKIDASSRNSQAGPRLTLILALRQGTRPRLPLLPICALLLFLLFPRSSASAAALNTGHISGKVLNGSHNNVPVAEQSVTLQLAENNTASDLITLKTDAQGNYAFSALQSDTTVQYAVYTLYQNAQYATDLIDLSKNANQKVDLMVYDATTSVENIAVVQASILISKPDIQTGMLSISEDFFFENLGTTSYVGQLDASHGKPNALSFFLPTGARLLSLGAGFDGYTSTQVDTGFASNAAVVPGTSRFSFSFQVPYSGTGYHFTYKTLYPTVLLTLLTPINVLTTTADLTSKGPTNTKSDTYDSFEGKTLSAGKTIQAQLDGLPTPTKNAQQPSFNPNLIWLIALLIVLLALVGVGAYLYNTRRRQAANSKRQPNRPSRKDATPTHKKATVLASKEVLLQELLALDQAYEVHKLKKAAYYEQRTRLKARLREVMEQPASKQAEKSAETPDKTARSSGKGAK